MGLWKVITKNHGHIFVVKNLILISHASRSLPPFSYSQSWYCRIKSGRVGKMWGRKYPSVSPLLCPHCTDHYYSLTHTWPSGGWGLLFVITTSDDGQFSRCMVLCQMSAQFTIFTSSPLLALMSDQYLEMSQQRELLWTEIIGLKILHWVIF